MLFLSPVLYPVTAVPVSLRPIYEMNPLSPVISATRAVLQGLPVDWSNWGIALLLGAGICVLGTSFFFYSRDEFADAL
jgi:lipopolysaccharide transport system permease protein